MPRCSASIWVLNAFFRRHSWPARVLLPGSNLSRGSMKVSINGTGVVKSAKLVGIDAKKPRIVGQETASKI